VEELHGDPTVGPCPKVWTRQSSAKNGVPERLRCGAIQKEASITGGEYILKLRS